MFNIFIILHHCSYLERNNKIIKAVSSCCLITKFWIKLLKKILSKKKSTFELSKLKIKEKKVDTETINNYPKYWTISKTKKEKKLLKPTC